jgi:hypothetical protein
MLFKKITNIVFDGINHNDYPHYCDAFIVSADWAGLEMNEEELEKLNEDREFVLKELMKYLTNHRLILSITPWRKLLKCYAK